MHTIVAPGAEIFTAREIARAAGVDLADVRALLRTGRIRALENAYIAEGEAVRAVRVLREGLVARPRELFARRTAGARTPGRAMLASSALHAAMLATLVLAAGLGLDTANEPAKLEAVRLVFLPLKGSGGGGGGGGLRQPAPVRRAEMKGERALRSPIPPPRPVSSQRPKPRVERPLTPPVRPAPLPRPIDPPPPIAPPAPAPQVFAPVAASASDARDRGGVLESETDTASQGSGAGSGAGSGHGTGMGEGEGSGIGPGSGGGTGGGPYRPGSGITPPELIREIRPQYTDEARRRGVTGDVVLEIVVRRDGRVGEVRILQGLGAGLDKRAVDAVRQWHFDPARRHGTPVDVLVEVSVEFKLR